MIGDSTDCELGLPLFLTTAACAVVPCNQLSSANTDHLARAPASEIALTALPAALSLTSLLPLYRHLLCTCLLQAAVMGMELGQSNAAWLLDQGYVRAGE